MAKAATATTNATKTKKEANFKAVLVPVDTYNMLQEKAGELSKELGFKVSIPSALMYILKAAMEPKASEESASAEKTDK